MAQERGYIACLPSLGVRWPSESSEELDGIFQNTAQISDINRNEINTNLLSTCLQSLGNKQLPSYCASASPVPNMVR